METVMVMVMIPFVIGIKQRVCGIVDTEIGGGLAGHSS